MNTSEAFIKAICLSFLHSLWQALFIFCFVSILLRVIRKDKPALRSYVISSGYLFFVFAFISTLIYQLPRFSDPGVIIFQLLNTGAKSSNFYLSITNWIEENALLIMGAWTIIFIIKVLMLARSLAAIKKMRTSGLTNIPNEWKDRWRKITERLNFKPGPGLYQSVNVLQPVLTGWVKPIILVPVGFFNNLTLQEAEAILLHELAHIKRRDYLFNLLQSIVDCIFFFNPFVLLLSNELRREREFCCDQWAVARVPDKTAFISGLLFFGEQRRNLVALGISGINYPLTDRVERLLKIPYRSLSIYPAAAALILMTALIAGFMLMIELTGNKPHSNMNVVPSVHGISSLSTVKSDTIPKGVSKEWLDGYNAAKNYRAGTKQEKYALEQSYMKKQEKEGALKKSNNATHEYENKRKIEEELLKRQ